MLVVRQPGIYIQSQSTPEEPVLRLNSKGITGFVGISERGPLQKAIRISSFETYQKIFGGFNCPGFMPYAVYGFFNSGGTECVVVRTAGQSGSGSVSCAEYTVNNLSQKAFAKFVTVSEGSWGNSITIKLWHSVVDRIEPIEIDTVGKGFELKDNTRIEIGAYIRIQAEGRVYYRKIKKITATRIYLDREIKSLVRFSQHNVKIEVLNFNCSLSDGKCHENYLLLSTNPNSDNYFVDVINRRSSLVRVVKETTVDGFPEEVSFRTLSKGRDGVLNIKPGDFIGEYYGNVSGRGLGIFEGIEDINVIAIPDSQIFSHLKLLSPNEASDAIFTVQTAMISHCEKQKNRFALLDVPNYDQPTLASNWIRRFDTMHAATYFPFVEMIDPADRRGIHTITVPPSGHIAGSMQKIDRTEGQIHPPANVYLPGIVGLSFTFDDGECDFLYQSKINVLKSIPGRGVKVWGARTLSSDEIWRFISIRRTFTLIAEALQAGTSWAVFETNSFSLRKRLIRNISGFLVNLWRDGYLAGKTAEEAFFVRCDNELNPVEEVDIGRLTVEVGFALAKPTEFIVIQLAAERESSNVVIDEKLL